MQIIHWKALMFLNLALRSSNTVAFCPKRNLASLSSILSSNSHQLSTIISSSSSNTATTTTTTTTRNMSQFWNREESAPKSYDSNKPIIKQAKIISLSAKDDPANVMLHKSSSLPDGASLLAIGTTLEEFDMVQLMEEKPNVIFVSHPKAREPLGELLNALPSIEWIHSRSAGIDFITSDALTKAYQNDNDDDGVQVTNAKGSFSSTLAEYTLMACSYFAKDLPRLFQQKNKKHWEKYNVKELRGSTLGIIGYGDIGRAAAKLATAYGMKVIALRRNPQKGMNDPYCDVVYGNDKDSMNKLFSESDYVLCSAPLTPETKGMITKEQFDVAKKDACFINVGRGPIVNEEDLVDALKSRKLKGAGLDVFATEPLPETSELWELDNVLLSPHNMDMTETFMQEATEFFVEENLPRFVRGEDLLNPVDAAAGY
eukprot:scaffold1312_cov122-Cylindrotheca_fusiformis.AAC.3